ncbi:MAG: 30S ribosomal protein S7 [Candidatus Methanoperedens sp.]|jgi:small subunit ribosomal protein S7|nr:30S ribosomal protein S7 [Candidatus Methanoperedens sp.]PKL54650.1 MAG: 30S ribosomal protein S7 [Candidatus Methanoperedenaceae archaeon HGW-Methanoperedenaceae-1]
MQKLFGKWDFTEVEVTDVGVRNYIDLTPTSVPHSGGKNSKQQFAKSTLNIVERLINKLMREEHNTGQKITVYKNVKSSFEIINKKTGQNPIQVLVNAIANAGPREETVRLRYGGIAVPKAVDVAPQRRVDTALRLISEGAHKASFTTKKPLPNSIADEIISAATWDVKGYAMGKKDNMERVSKAAR